MGLDPYLAEWTGLLLRWFHLTLGIAWIGASFYFVWLNNAVRPLAVAEPRVAGDVWSVHGGAFYRVVKFAGAPEQLPHELHWFRWEAYLTWLSGFALLVLHFWSSPSTALIGPASPPWLGPASAVALSAAVLALGFAVYDGACRWLADRPTALAALLAAGVALAAYGLYQVFAPRAAYLHVGAMLGTWMAGNVLFVIIPGQRAMVAAMIEGRAPPVERGKAGALRSLHNNYFTLPVLFVMVSGHFPSTWGHPLGWLVLLGIAAAGVAVRHALNVAERGSPKPWLYGVALVAVVGAAGLARPVRATGSTPEAPVVSMTQVQVIVAQRCLPCHAAEPILGGFATAPKGVILDRPEAIEAYRDAIRTQVVRTRVMPLGNLTSMTDAERAILAAWTGP